MFSATSGRCLQLSSIPLLRGGLAFGAVLELALTADPVSVLIMMIVDNAIMLVLHGARCVGLDSGLFWGNLTVALLIAGAVAFPIDRWLIKLGEGHAVVRKHHQH